WNKLTYEEYKEMVILKDVNSRTKQKFNVTVSTSILLQDIQEHANKLIRGGDLRKLKRLFIVMPNSDSIGLWRNYIPNIAKKYFMYKVGTEILVGSSLHNNFITANFKLILWIFHI